MLLDLFCLQMFEYGQLWADTCMREEPEEYPQKHLHGGKGIEMEEERGSFVHLLSMFLSLNLHPALTCN